MAGIAMLEGWTITSLETVEIYDRITKDCLAELDEVKDVSLKNTEDKSEVKGKGGNTLFVIKKNKGLTGSGTSGYISGNLMAIQTGTSAVAGSISFKKRNVVKFESAATTVLTSETASGTVGAEIISFKITIGEVTTAYTQATTASATKFSYDPSTKTITLPTGVATGAGEVEVVYNYTKTGASISNRTDTYGKTCELILSCLGKNICDEIYFIQIVIPRADFTSNFDLAIGGDSTDHPFEFVGLVDKCSGDEKLWDFKVYKTV